METSLNLRHVRACGEVARDGSVTKAAERVHLSQPALTQAISKLEKTLDTTLFIRKNRRLYPTEAGALFSRRADRAGELLREGVENALTIGGRRGAVLVQSLANALTRNHLRVLLAVETSASYSAAARRLDVAQPSVFRTAKDLEAILGVPIFKKGARAIELSTSGLVLAKNARLAFAELRQGISEVQVVSGTGTVVVDIGLLPMGRTIVIPEAINLLVARYRQSVVNAVEGQYDALLRALGRGEIDVMFGALRPDIAPEFIQEPVFDDQLAVVVGPDHPLAGQPDINRRDLDRFQWIVPRDGTPTREQFDRMIQSGHWSLPQSRVESSSLELVSSLLSANQHVAIISARQSQNAIETGALAKLPIVLDDAARPIGITMRVDWLPTESQRQFLQYIRKTASEFGTFA